MAEPSTAQTPSIPVPRRVRRAEPRDVAAMHAMVVELAEYERSPGSVEATADDLRAALFGGPGRQVAHGHVAEVRDGAGAGGDDRSDERVERGSDDGADDGGPGGWRVAGIAVWFPTYSTWTGRAGIWLEDLYVSPRRRGLGLGRALLAALAATCTREGHRRLEWTVLDWNTPAQGVYRAVGAAPLEDWTTWRLDGDALAALAATAGADGPAGARAGDGDLDRAVPGA